MVDATDLDSLLGDTTPAKKPGRPRKTPATEAPAEEKKVEDTTETEKTPEEPKAKEAEAPAEKKEDAPAAPEKAPEEKPAAKVEEKKEDAPAEAEKVSDAPEAEYKESDEEDDDAEVIAVQFLTGGFTTQYGVQAEESVLHYTVGTREYNRTKDSNGNSWLDLIDDRKAQVKRFGAHVFQRFED